MVNPQRTLSKELKTLVNNKEFSDVVFKVEDTPLYAHRAVLAARCTRLQQMFSNLSKEQQTRPVPEIPIPNVRFDVFLAMMEFLYRFVVFTSAHLLLLCSMLGCLITTYGAHSTVTV